MNAERGSPWPSTPSHLPKRWCVAFCDTSLRPILLPTRGYMPRCGCSSAFVRGLKMNENELKKEREDMLSEYRFDYNEARPNRFGNCLIEADLKLKYVLV